MHGVKKPQSRGSGPRRPRREGKSQEQEALPPPVEEHTEGGRNSLKVLKVLTAADAFSEDRAMSTRAIARASGVCVDEVEEIVKNLISGDFAVLPVLKHADSESYRKYYVAADAERVMATASLMKSDAKSKLRRSRFLERVGAAMASGKFIWGVDLPDDGAGDRAEHGRAIGAV